MKLIFLGTGAGIPSKKRNVSCAALQFSYPKNRVWLFDCGDGSQRQIMRANINPNKIEQVFITHLHSDHLFGLPSLISNISKMDRTKKLTVYGPTGIKTYIELNIAISQSHIAYPLEIIEISEGIIYQEEAFSVEAVALKHRVPCFGYRIVEQSRVGNLSIEKLQKDNIPRGPWLADLKKGQTVTLEDGRKINGMNYFDPPKKGRVIAIFGDTEPTENAVKLAKNSDIMMHEATFDAKKTELAIKYGHSTTEQAATVAKEANTKKLILTHISPRYPSNEEDTLLNESQAIFPETYMAHDFDEFDIL